MCDVFPQQNNNSNDTSRCVELLAYAMGKYSTVKKGPLVPINLKGSCVCHSGLDAEKMEVC
jgi:hypothetical protein